MLYHDVKAKCMAAKVLAAKVLGARQAFFQYFVLEDGRTPLELGASEEVYKRMPKLLEG